MSVSVVSKRRSVIAEGPFWVKGQNKLLYVDIPENAVCRLDPATMETETLMFEKNVSFVIPWQSDPNKFVISVGPDIQTLEGWTTKNVRHLASSESGDTPTRFNDAKCDGAGRLWAGTMALETAPAVVEPEKGSLYSLGKGHDLTKHVDKITISNGMAWTSDNKTMFYVDSYPRSVYAFDFDLQNGTVSNQRTVVDFNKTPGYNDFAYPDGLTIDLNEKLWLACYDAGVVLNIDPTTGKLLNKVKFPASKITSCCFGGANYDELYVTSASCHLTTEELKYQPDAGAIFAVKGLGAKGMDANSFSP